MAYFMDSDYGIILVNGEMDMLEYRLKLHRSMVTKFVIKSNQTSRQTQAFVCSLY